MWKIFILVFQQVCSLFHKNKSVHAFNMAQNEQLCLWQSRNYNQPNRQQTESQLEILRNNLAQIKSDCENHADCYYFECACAIQLETYASTVKPSEGNDIDDIVSEVGAGFVDRSKSWESKICLNSQNIVESGTQISPWQSCHCCNPLVSIIQKHAYHSLPLTSVQSSNSNGSNKRGFSEQHVASCVTEKTNYGIAFIPSEKASEGLCDNQSSGSRTDLCGTIGPSDKPCGNFRSARQQLELERRQNGSKSPLLGNNSKRKVLGSRPKSQCFAKFIPPSSKNNDAQAESPKKAYGDVDKQSYINIKGIEPQLVELVISEIMENNPSVDWTDIAGLEYAKETIREIVVWPLLRPDIFTGLRGPPKGILLFGPPGTGKTLIGKCIASQSGATFFSISASSLTSKWVGQGEKMVRALFSVAKLHQPAVIFIDEIDSLLSQRSDTEHESSRRIKTEFFVQLDGATTSSDERILVVGATNRPQEIDEAARRRLVKRLYIPLPDSKAREEIVLKLLSKQDCHLTREDIQKLVRSTEGFSGADVTNLCKEAALGPIRSLKVTNIANVHKDDLRPIQIQDFEHALQRVRPSVSKKDLVVYKEWNEVFGCGL